VGADGLRHRRIGEAGDLHPFGDGLKLVARLIDVADVGKAVDVAERRIVPGEHRQHEHGDDVIAEVGGDVADAETPARIRGVRMSDGA